MPNARNLSSSGDRQTPDPFVPVDYRGKRVLVTGASGFIGRWVARLLTLAGARVIPVARDTANLRTIAKQYRIEGEHLAADFSNAGEFARVFQAARPTITFNLVGYGVDRNERDDQLARRLNVELVEEIACVIASAARPAEWTGLQLVHVGSAFEYGCVSDAVTEQSIPQPVNSYGEMKLAGTQRLEAVCRETGLRATTARVGTVYGPGEHDHRLLPSLLHAARTGESLELTGGKQERDFTYVEDVAAGLLRLGVVSSAVPPVVNLATGQLSTVRRFIESVRDIVGMRPEQLRIGALPYRGDEVLQGRIDVSLLERLLDWRPTTTIEAGIQKSSMFPVETAGGVT